LFWEVGVLSNLWLLAVVAVSIVLQIALHSVAWAQAIFQTEIHAASDWLVALGGGLVPVTVLEVRKLVSRARRRAGGPA
jgi:Ca2+-transporting ATPase